SPTLLALHLPPTLPPTPALYTLSLHDALPISPQPCGKRRSCSRKFTIGSKITSRLSPACSTFSLAASKIRTRSRCFARAATAKQDRKSTRLNSSHVAISYAVFCLKKKKHET